MGRRGEGEGREKGRENERREEEGSDVARSPRRRVLILPTRRIPPVLLPRIRGIRPGLRTSRGLLPRLPPLPRLPRRLLILILPNRRIDPVSESVPFHKNLSLTNLHG